MNVNKNIKKFFKNQDISKGFLIGITFSSIINLIINWVCR